MSNLQSLYSPLPLNARQQQQPTQRSHTDSKQLITQRTQRTYSVQGEGNKLQYSIEKGSYSGDLSGGKSFQSPYSWKAGGQGLSGVDNKITKSISQYISNNTNYGTDSISPIIGNQTYRSFRSPSEKVTAFDGASLGYKDTLSQYNHTSKLNEGNKSTLKYIDSTSQIQQQLYRNPQQPTTSTNYQYQKIINHQLTNNNQYTNRNILNGKTLSPMNYLTIQDKNKAIDNNNDYRSQFFNYYSAGLGQNINGNNNYNVSTVPVTQQKQQGYQTTNLGSSINYTSSYKPLLASTQQYDQQRYMTLSRPPQQNNIQSQQIYTSPSIHHSAYPQSNYQSLQQTQQQQQNTYQLAYQPLTTLTNTQQQQKVNKQNYNIIDEIQRPVYDKLYINKQENRRLTVDRDPPRSNAFCGPLLWIPLLLIGLTLAALGMLCGLGVICKDSGAVLKESYNKGQVPVIPVAPIQPVQPVEPIQPIYPTQPVYPTQPTYPAQPVQPITPVYIPPSQPQWPITPTIIIPQQPQQIYTPSMTPNQTVQTNTSITPTTIQIPPYTPVTPQVQDKTQSTIDNMIDPHVIAPIPVYNTQTVYNVTPTTYSSSTSSYQTLADVGLLPSIDYQSQQSYFTQPQMHIQPNMYEETTDQINTQPIQTIDTQPIQHIQPQMHIQPTITPYTITNTYAQTQTFPTSQTNIYESQSIQSTETLSPQEYNTQTMYVTPSTTTSIPTTNTVYQQPPTIDTQAQQTQSPTTFTTSPTVTPIQPNNVIATPLQMSTITDNVNQDQIPTSSIDTIDQQQLQDNLIEQSPSTAPQQLTTQQFTATQTDTPMYIETTDDENSINYPIQPQQQATPLSADDIQPQIDDIQPQIQ